MMQHRNSSALFLITLYCVACASPSAFAQAKIAPRIDELPIGARLQLGTTRWRHATGISYVFVMPDSKRVLTASRDHVIRLWERDTGKEIRRFESSAIQQGIEPGPFRDFHAAVSPDGKILAAGFWNYIIPLWDVASGKEIRQIKPLTKGISAMRFANSGKLLAVRDWGQKLTLFDLETGKEQTFKNDPKDGDVSPGCAAGMAFSRDGLFIANGRLGTEGMNLQFFLQILNTKTGEELVRIQTKSNPAAITYAPKGDSFAYSIGNVIHLRANDGDKEIRQIDCPAPPTALRFSTDAKLIVGKALDNQVRVWNADTGKLLHEWGEKGAFPPELVNRTSESRDLALSADNRVAVWADRQSVRLFDIRTGADLVKPLGHRAAVTTFAIGSDSKSLLSHGEDDTLRVWDLTTGQSPRTSPVPAGTTIARIAPDGRTAALANEDGTVRLLDFVKGTEFDRFKGHVSPDPSNMRNDTADLAFSADGKYLACQGSFDNTIKIYDVARRNEIRQWTIRPFNPADEIIGFRHRFLVHAGLGLAFSPDGQTLAVNIKERPSRDTWPEISRVRQWDLATGKEYAPIVLPARHFAEQIAYSPDGRLLAASHGDQTVSLFETASGKLRAVLGKPQAAAKMPWTYQRRYEPVPLKTLAFSPDGSKLLSRAGFDVLRIWDVNSALEIGQCKGHDGLIIAAAFAPDGQSIVTAGNDTTLILWDAKRFQGKPISEVALSENEIKAHWDNLLVENPKTAFASMQKLAASPKTSVPFLTRILKPAHTDLKKIEQLVADLNRGELSKRNQASIELADLGELARHALQAALDDSPSLEARRRIETLLQRLTPIALTANDLRIVRGVEVLERAGTAESRETLRRLAVGAPGALVTRHAKSALDRLRRR